jgi:UDP-N-acetyl-D-mannosaminuronate dehydrogenase
MKKRFEKIQLMSSFKTAELAKILVDTTYYGWLINYAQITKMICDKEGIDFDEMWKFADEIHENLGNRPKMYPGIIGGHCVIPNLNLIENSDLEIIRKINKMFSESKK